MKRIASILIMLSVLFFAHYIKAQSANDNYLFYFNVWAVVADDINQTGADTKITYCYSWGKDSLINSMTYREITLGYDHPGYFLDMRSDKTYYSLLYYREDGKRIYRYDNDWSKDVLLYDFDISVGDEITILDGKRVRVTEEFCTDELEDYCYPWPDKTPAKAWRVKGVDDENYEDIWIDGAGSLYTGLLLRKDFPEDTSLTCVFNPTSGFLRYAPFDKIQPVWLEYLNDSKEWERFYVNVEFVDDTLKISGDGTFYLTLIQLFRCHLDGNVISLSAVPTNPMSSLTEGILYSEFEVKFPGFEAGEYTVKLENWGYGGVHLEDTTIVCYGPATGVPDINSSKIKNNDNAIYELSGRRLSSPPERGIYIHGGKKIILK